MAEGSQSKASPLGWGGGSVGEVHPDTICAAHDASLPQGHLCPGTTIWPLPRAPEIRKVFRFVSRPQMPCLPTGTWHAPSTCTCDALGQQRRKGVRRDTVKQRKIAKGSCLYDCSAREARGLRQKLLDYLVQQFVQCFQCPALIPPPEIPCNVSGRHHDAPCIPVQHGPCALSC